MNTNGDDAMWRVARFLVRPGSAQQTSSRRAAASKSRVRRSQQQRNSEGNAFGATPIRWCARGGQAPANVTRSLSETLRSLFRKCRRIFAAPTMPQTKPLGHICVAAITCSCHEVLATKVVTHACYRSRFGGAKMPAPGGTCNSGACSRVYMRIGEPAMLWTS
jgi:hypothetical protein